ncbi:helix-turn-helix domain-containing protein [Ramlibacter sp. WS9]|uniref:helix-turn-helix domain-containing protein n=1 Tax=Ramlibacter sp. WS9 TaxID=1882741 RepID=UPI0013052123|nr:AraC family transcriptional regulator [Ramlibacter sp. WS9]
MGRIPGQQEEANPLGERNLLSAEAAAHWRGFAMAWLEASPHVEVGDSEVITTRLAMLDSGCAQAEFAYGRKSFDCDLTAGAIGLFAQGTHMNRIRWKCQDVRRIIVEVDLARLSDPVWRECVRQLPQETQVEFRDEGLAAMLRSMVAEAASGSVNGQLYAESLSLGVALRLQQRAANRARVSCERGKLTAVQVERLEEWIGVHLAEDISLAQLARIAGFSPAHFVRLFKNSLGCAPYRHVLNIRLERARQLLLASDLPIAAIAVETGFASQSHLTTAFVREHKVPPGQLRRSEAVRVRCDPPALQ